MNNNHYIQTIHLIKIYKRNRIKPKNLAIKFLQSSPLSYFINTINIIHITFIMKLLKRM